MCLRERGTERVIHYPHEGFITQDWLTDLWEQPGTSEVCRAGGQEGRLCSAGRSCLESLNTCPKVLRAFRVSLNRFSRFHLIRPGPPSMFLLLNNFKQLGLLITSVKSLHSNIQISV